MSLVARPGSAPHSLGVVSHVKGQHTCCVAAARQHATLRLTAAIEDESDLLRVVGLAVQVGLARAGPREVAVARPDDRIKYATGTTQPRDAGTRLRLKGELLKVVVRQAVIDTYGVTTEGTAKYDEADAYILMAMGLHWLGWPLAVVSDERRTALDSVRWPERAAVIVK